VKDTMNRVHKLTPPAASRNRSPVSRVAGPPPTLGPRLRAIRQREGIGLRELARRLDLSPSAISQIETGKTSGTLRVVVGFDDFHLGPGDSVTDPSTTPHRLSNEGEQPVQAICVVRGRRGTQVGPDAS
jgi:DNA-binding XRE family transcriptional regulator